MIDGDELSIFPDQRSFLHLLDEAGPSGAGTKFRGPSSTSDPTACTVRHPDRRRDGGQGDLRRQASATSSDYQADWRPWLDDMKAGWNRVDRSPRRRSGPGGNHCSRWRRRLCGPRSVPMSCSVRWRPPRERRATRDLIDFPNAEVRAHSPTSRTPSDSTSTTPRRDGSPPTRRSTGPTHCSCRAAGPAWREGDFNEYLYNFFKSLSRRAHASHRGRSDPQRTSTRCRRKPNPRSGSRGLHRAAAMPAPQRRPVGVRRDRSAERTCSSAPSTAGDSTARPVRASRRRTKHRCASGRPEPVDSRRPRCHSFATEPSRIPGTLDPCQVCLISGSTSMPGHGCGCADRRPVRPDRTDGLSPARSSCSRLRCRRSSLALAGFYDASVEAQWAIFFLGGAVLSVCVLEVLETVRRQQRHAGGCRRRPPRGPDCNRHLGHCAVRHRAPWTRQGARRGLGCVDQR